MKQPLSVLIIEDSADDAELLVWELERSGFEVTHRRVETPDTLSEALDEREWDIMLADYTMPRFKGTEALAMVRERDDDVPFMFVSGTIGEEVAVEAMKAGANDYFIKGALMRLAPAIARELREAAIRREGKRIEEERVVAEEALRASEERHRLLFEHIADAILVLDQEGTVLLASASAPEVLGRTPEELVGRSTFDLVHPEDQERARESLRRVTSRPDGVETVDLRLEHGDGSWREMGCVTRNLLHRPDVGGLVVTVRDVTERKRLEAEFLQAQKLESVGRLAGGVAHDFNNLLTAVLGNADFLLMDRDLTPEQRQEIGEIRRAAERATHLTRHLLAFSRRQVLRLRALNLHEVIEDVTPMLNRLLGEQIEVRSYLAPVVGTVRADPGQVEQVLVNLAVNAKDAMPEGGSLTIETANVELDESYVEQHPSATGGRHVLLMVSDTGVGMDAETRAHAFEPFFTTKDAREGTGLGLSTVYGIVKQSGGNIWLYSEPGKGTTFKIYFPRVDEPAEPLVGQAEERELPRGTETVLLVEDEPAVRRLAARLLREQGYTVIDMEDGVAALQYIIDGRRGLDLLLTDAVLPGIGGHELVERARKRVPDLPALFMSGYATPVLTEQGILSPDVDLLEKPFTAVALARKVREVLDRGG